MPDSRLEKRTGGAFLNKLLVWCPRIKLKKFPMDFGPRPGARRVKADRSRGMPRAGLNARNGLRAGPAGHSSAMATTSNAAFGAKGIGNYFNLFTTHHTS